MLRELWLSVFSSQRNLASKNFVWTIDGSFPSLIFAIVMTTAVGLALASALSAFMMIEGKKATSALGAFQRR